MLTMMSATGQTGSRFHVRTCSSLAALAAHMIHMILQAFSTPRLVYVYMFRLICKYKKYITTYNIIYIV